MATAKTPAGNEVEIIVTAEHGSYLLQSGQLRKHGIAIGWWSQTGSTPRLADALAKADETIAALGLTA